MTKQEIPYKIYLEESEMPKSYARADDGGRARAGLL